MNRDLRKELERLTTPPDGLTERSDDGAWENWLADQMTNISDKWLLGIFYEPA
jgi:hypothetical protein